MSNTDKKPATMDQLKALCLMFVQLFFEILANKRGAPSLLHEQTQNAIKMETSELLESLTEFINNNCRMGLKGVIDMSAPTGLNYRNSKLIYRTHEVSNLQRFDVLKRTIKIVNKLKEGEKSISGTEFLHRLEVDKEILINSNFLVYLYDNNNDASVKEFFKEYFDEKLKGFFTGKHLYAFGDIFEETKDLQFIHCIRQVGKNWVTWISYLTDTSFDQNCYALVMETEILQAS